jgi:prepilin signal peptidase PulO-like enzyme (type II secretory pathway)
LRYFGIELITGLVFVSIYLRFGPGVQTVAYCLFMAPLIAAFCTDVDAFLIPDQLHLFALFVGISFNVYGIITGLEGHRLLWGWLPASIWGGFICTAIFLAIQVFGWIWKRKLAMGDGDVKLARAIGAMLPLNLALVSFFIAVAVGAVWGIAKIIRESIVAGAADDEEDAADAEDSEEDEMGGFVGILQWSGIYLFYIDALLFGARAFRISRLVPAANIVVPVENIEDDDFNPGATHIPFGPFMVVGVLLAIFFGKALLDWYLGWTGLAR